MENNEKDVSVASLKKPRIVVTWKHSVSKALKNLQVEVDNPLRKKEKPTKPKPDKKEEENGPVANS